MGRAGGGRFFRRTPPGNRGGGQAEHAGFNSGAHRAGIKNVRAKVPAVVQTGHDQIGGVAQQGGQRKLDAVRRRAVHRPADKTVFLNVINMEPAPQGKRGADPGVFLQRRDDMHLMPAFAKSGVQGMDAGRVDAVVIGQKNAHGVNPREFRPPAGLRLTRSPLPETVDRKRKRVAFSHNRPFRTVGHCLTLPAGRGLPRL